MKRLHVFAIQAVAIPAVALLAVLSAGGPSRAEPAPAEQARPASAIHWNAWGDDLFPRAQAETRFVILDLEAVWCHWCHVMEQKTYADPKVGALIASKYLAVRADQDANPDLSARYGDWGWPATIIFGPDGTEIAKLRGYIPPERMADLLQAIIDDPSPGPSVGEDAEAAPSVSAFFSKEQREALVTIYDDTWDEENAGWGEPLKYIDADSLDYAIARTEAGDATAEKQARRTLDAALALIDPVWGGVYQYSDKLDWKSPHFEKIISFQAQYLRQYSQAYARWKEPRYLAAAKAIESYLTGTLMSPEGAFYVSQDADLSHEVDGHVYYALSDTERRAKGIPRVDTHLYARENGWAISALAAYANTTGDAPSLAAAEKAARWVQANRALPGGGFRHGDADRGGPFLSDTVAMGQAFVDLYAATGKRDWLVAAGEAGRFIAATFSDEAGGFAASRSAEAKVGVLAKPSKPVDDQVAVARFMTLLGRYTGKTADKDVATHALRYLVGVAPDLLRPLPGVLLADREAAAEPTHITVVGHKDDPAAQALYAMARGYPARNKRLDWWDVREGPLPNPDVEYPELDKAAAFACNERLCSSPTFSAAELRTAVEQISKLHPGKETVR